MNWSDIFGFTALLVVLIQIFFNHWLKKSLDKAALLQKQRESNIAVTEILSEWIHSAYQSVHLNNEQLWKLQSIYWKNIMLLDKQIIEVLLPTLANAPGAINANDIIAKTRQLILNLKTPDIKGTDLNNWPPIKP